MSALAIACVLLPACGSGRLTPTQTCATSIEAAARCGAYHVGGFGGRTQDEDIAICAMNIGRFSDHCQDLSSQAAQCLAAHSCTTATACQPILDALNRDCRGP